MVALTAGCGGGGGGGSVAPAPQKGAIFVGLAGESGFIASSAASPYVQSGFAPMLQITDTATNEPTVNVAVLTTPDPTAISNGGCLTVSPRSLPFGGGTVDVYATSNSGCKYPVAIELQFTDTDGSPPSLLYMSVSP